MNAVRFIHVPGGALEYELHEPSRAQSGRPTIVMLHEGLGSVSMWKDFPHRLAEATGCRTVAYSRFGYGRSAAPPQPHTALTMHEREALEVLPRVLQELGIERPVLFGHSDGASIALIYAARHHDAAAAVIAMAPHVFVEDMCLASIVAARQSYLKTDFPSRLARYHDHPDRAFWLWNDVWLDPAFRAWNIEHFLPSITCPVLAIQGHEDEYGTMQQLERLARATPQSHLVKLQGCRHSPHRDRPAEVLAATRLFVQQCNHMPTPCTISH
jgi:pimeloyl-ACP methyl ester carboxylesterase